MRIRWRGLELPSTLERDESVSSDTYGRFIIEPFERGFGTTLGNSLRRILLSSLEGAAVTGIKIAEAPHEFTSIPGVLEDVTSIVLNVKSVVVRSDFDETVTMKVSRTEAGEVRAGDIQVEQGLEIINPDQLICTLTTEASFNMELTVGTGRGYASADENRGGTDELGVIPIDSVFSPVLRVRYKTEDTRVGKRTNYDRLILEVWTRGTVTPQDALVEAAKILRKHLSPFIMYDHLGSQMVYSSLPEPKAELPAVNTELEKLWNTPISTLGLSVRASNCLESARIMTLGALASKTESDLLRLRAFGKTSLREIRRKLGERGMSLGMKVDNLDDDMLNSGGEVPPPDNFSVPVEQNS